MVWKRGVACRKIRTETAMKVSSNKAKDGPFVETDKNGKLVRKGTYKMGRLSN